MVSINILTRGKSIFSHVVSDLQKFSRQTHLEIDLNEITDIQEISSQNPPAIPCLTMDGQPPIYMNQGEYIHTFCSRVRRWIVDAVGYGSMPRVLVPTDFSDASLNALRYALQRYRGSYAVIELISAHMEVVGSLNDVPVVDDYTLGLLNDRMTKLVDELMADEENKNIIIKGKIITGPVVSSILQAAEEVDHTIIYIGSSGASGLMKHLFGSTTRQLVKKVSVPTFIIPPEYKGSAIMDVGLAVSDPNQDAPLFKKLYDLIGSFNPTLHLIHSRTDRDDFDFEPYKTLAKDFHSHLIKTMLLTNRDVVASLVKYINANNFQLMVMSHYERPLLESLFHKSISKQVVAEVKCPILILNANTVDSDKQSESLISEVS